MNDRPIFVDYPVAKIWFIEMHRDARLYSPRPTQILTGVEILLKISWPASLIPVSTPGYSRISERILGTLMK